MFVYISMYINVITRAIALPQVFKSVTRNYACMFVCLRRRNELHTLNNDLCVCNTLRFRLIVTSITVTINYGIINAERTPQHRIFLTVTPISYIPGSPLSRVSPPVYEDGVYQPSGSTRPNPLLLSSALMSSDDVTKSKKSFRNSSVLMVFFGE